MNTFLKLLWFPKTLYSLKLIVLNIDSPGIKDTVCNNMQCTLNTIQYIKDFTITIPEVSSAFTARKSRQVRGEKPIPNQSFTVCPSHIYVNISHSRCQKIKTTLNPQRT